MGQVVRVFLALVLLAVPVPTLVPSRALAQSAPRVVVERFRGPRASRLRAMLVDDLRAHGVVVLDDTEVQAAEDGLGLRGERRSETDYVALAGALRASAFVSGSVSRARRSWRLTLRVRNGADGTFLGSESWGGRTTSAMDGVGRTGAERLREHLARARAPSTAVAPTPGEEPWYRRRHVDDEEPPEDAEEEAPRPAAPSSSRFDALRLSVSGGTLWRSMSAIASVYAVRRGGMVSDPATELTEEERSYRSQGIGHLELGIEAELYPGALGNQPFPWLGVLVSFRHSAFLSSSGCRRTAAECSSPAERVVIGTEQLDLQVGARGRYRFGERRGDVEIFLEVLWGLSTFTLDTVAMQQIDYEQIVPPAEYQYVAVGGGVQLSPVPDALSIAARADWRPGVGIGAKTREVWGVETGPAGGWLVGLEVRHEASWLAEGAFAALRFEYFQFQTTFRGQVGCATPSGCPLLPPNDQWMDDNLWEPWPVDAEGNVVGGIRDPVVDHYVRWGLYLGYAFR